MLSGDFELSDVPTIRTPCVGICTLDGQTGWCKGCGRTASEVGAWGTMTDAEREDVMNKLPDRVVKLWEGRRSERRDARGRGRRGTRD